MSNVCTIFYEACGAVCADISRWFGRVAARPSCQRRRPPWGWMKCQPSPGAPKRRHHHRRHRCHHHLHTSIENTTEICLYIVVTIASRGSGLRNFVGPLRISTIFIFRIQAVLQLQNHDKNAASKYKAPPNLKISTKFSFEHQSAIISAHQKLPKCTN